MGTGNAESAGYVSVGMELPITDSLAFVASYGNFHGDEIEAVLGTDDNYSDYTIGLAKSVEGFGDFGFTIVDTDLDDDDLEVVLSWNKGFDL